MRTLKASCPSCEQHVEYDENYGGMETDCPACTATMVLPIPSDMAVETTWVRWKRWVSGIRAGFRDYWASCPDDSKKFLTRLALVLGLWIGFWTSVGLWQGRTQYPFQDKNSGASYAYRSHNPIAYWTIICFEGGFSLAIWGYVPIHYYRRWKSSRKK